jgi:hypothetical protein
MGKTRKEPVMVGKLKTLALSLLVLAAISAVSASAVSAADVVTTGVSPALLTGVSHNIVLQRDVEGSTKVQCTTAKYAATVKNGDSQITADVEYEGTLNKTPHTERDCNASPSGNFTIDMNGCGYIMTGETTGKDVNGGTDSTSWIECPEGKQIQVTSSLGVTLSIPPQTSTKGGATASNVASHEGNSAVKLTITVTGLTVTCAPAFSCGLAGMPTHSNDYKYTGDITLTAFGDNEGLPTPVTEGARTSLSVSGS